MKTVDEVPLNICAAGKPHKEQKMHYRFAIGIFKVTSLLLSHMFLDMVKLQQEDLNTNWLTGLEMQASLYPVHIEVYNIS